MSSGDNARVLAAIGREWTAAPQDCWFCVWEGFGWDTASTFAALTETGQPPGIVEEPRPDPVPDPLREGPRVHLPHRDYLLYRGPAEAVGALASLDGTWGQCPNIWWPADRAGCVASEIDLQWTYVGGPRGLIDAVLADDRIEALPATPDDPVSRIEDWVSAWADQFADGLMASGAASLARPADQSTPGYDDRTESARETSASRSPDAVSAAAASALACAGTTRSSSATCTTT